MVKSEVNLHDSSNGQKSRLIGNKCAFHRWEVGPYAVTILGRRFSFRLTMGYKRASHWRDTLELCSWSGRTAPTGADAITRPVSHADGYVSTCWKGFRQLCPGCGRAMSVSLTGFFTKHKDAVVGEDFNSAERWGLEPGGRHRREGVG